jgi:hypothetical protein
VTEVSGTPMVVEPTGPAQFSVFQYTHSGIREPTNLTLLGTMGSDFHDGTPRNLIRTEDTELNAYNRLRLRTVRKGRHICYHGLFLGGGVKFGR